MFENLQVFRIAHAMAVHAGQRQSLVAQNVANADTPGYVARDLADFKEVYSVEDPTDQRATRTRHLHGSRAGTDFDPMQDFSHSSPDGNTVSVERQMLHAVDTMRQHDRALAIYKSALDILRMSLGKQ